MIRRLALTLLLLSPGLAQAQVAASTRDCVAAGLLVVESVAHGTQRVSRDPRGPDVRTLTVTIRNNVPAPVHFTASFPHPAVQQDFLAGQRFHIAIGQRETITVANVLRPEIADATVRQVLRTTCF